MDFKKIFAFFTSFIKALTQFMRALGVGNGKNQGAVDELMDNIQDIVDNAE